MSHTLAKLTYHCIFSTKHRKPLMDREWQERLYGYMAGILRNCDGRMIKTGGTADHVHLLFELEAIRSLAETLRLVKTNTSKWIHETFAGNDAFAWQTGYAAFTVSASAVDEVARYIEHQEEHHRRRTFDEELIEFARRHGITFDPERVAE